MQHKSVASSSVLVDMIGAVWMSQRGCECKDAWRDMRNSGLAHVQHRTNFVLKIFNDARTRTHDAAVSAIVPIPARRSP